MKTTILILTLMCNACYGQAYSSTPEIDKRFYVLGYVKAIDSVKINFGTSTDENYERITDNENYKLSDSVWISPDTAYIIFRYFYKVPNQVYDSATIYGNEPPVYHRKKDTVMVILLLGDTTLYNRGYMSQGTTMKQIKGEYKNEVKWKYGYSIRELHDANEDNNFPNMPYSDLQHENNYWKHLYYLNSNKESLSPNIIVWKSMEIK